MGIRQWKIPDIDNDVISRLGQETGLPELVRRVLAARGITSAEQAAIYSDSDTLESPFAIADMQKAVERIARAIEADEKICVYGDYDCDGITATALLTSYLQSVGGNASYYIPDRESEGYGLSIAAVEALSADGVGLIITVDNGISAHAEIARASGLGMDVVVTDHHTPRDTLPDAVAVVNPHRADCPSRYKDFAGVGVAFKLICALEDGDCDEMLEYYSGLVTIGTIADVVPLTGENRAIVRHGLASLAESDNPGIAALIEAAGLSDRAITGESVAYAIAPRINAAGRVGSAGDVVELLLTDDPDVARETAEQVSGQNDERKKLEDDILTQIDGMLRENPEIINKRVLIVTGHGWHHGVVGIVSARLTERYEKPCIVFSVDGGEARGSGRSVKGFSLIEAITACSRRLTRYGGHTLAAGLTLPEEFLDEFDGDMQAFARENYDVMPVPELAADASLSPRDMTPEAIGSLAALEPFGAGNESPLFHMGGLAIAGVYPTADNRHIRVRFAGGPGGWEPFYAVWFGVSGSAFPYKQGDIVEIMARLQLQEYNGKPQVSVKIADLRPGGVPQERVLLGRERYSRFLRGELPVADSAEEMLPRRDDIALVYKFLRREGGYAYGADALYLRLMAGGIDYCRLLFALDVLVELGFVRRSGGGSSAIELVPDAPRAELSASRILARLSDFASPVPAV